MVLLAVRMVADVTETRNVIPSWNLKLERQKSLLSFYCFEFIELVYLNNFIKF